MGFSELTTLQLGWAALAGAAVGFLSGVFGVGGGFLIVPVLRVFATIPISMAVGASACQVLGPATTSLLARRIRREDMRLPLTIAGGQFVGVFLGAWQLEWAKQYTKTHGGVPFLGSGVAFDELAVLVTYFVVLLGVGGFALLEVHRLSQNRGFLRGWLRGWRIPPYAVFPDVSDEPISIPLLSWFGLCVGYLAGFLGIGGGLILLPGLMYLVGLRTHDAIVSSLVIVWIGAVESTIVHAQHGNIDLILVIALLLGGTIGARLGSEVSMKLQGPQLRKCFGWLLLAAAALIAARLSRLIWV